MQENGLLVYAESQKDLSAQKFGLFVIDSPRAATLQLTKLAPDDARPFHKRPQRQFAFHEVACCAAWHGIANRIPLVVLDPVEAHVLGRATTVSAR